MKSNNILNYIFNKLFCITILLLILFYGTAKDPQIIHAQGAGGCECSCGCSMNNDNACLPCYTPPGDTTLDCSNDGPTNDCGPCEGYYGTNCPAGTVRTNIPISTYCVQGYYCGAGTAQTVNTPGCGSCGWVDFCTDRYHQKTGEWTESCVPVWECSRKEVTTYECAPICDSVAPTAPTLVSPGDGDNLTSTTVVLNWSAPSNWGTACIAGDKTYKLWIRYPNTVGFSSYILPEGTTSYDFLGTYGAEYFWAVSSVNGEFSVVSPTRSFTISVPNEPWWQTKDGDVTTKGSLSSTVPTNKKFGLNGLGGFPGVPVYGSTFNLSSEPVKVSTLKWFANSQTTESRLFDYSYFKNLIPGDTLINNISDLATGGSVSPDGYEYYKVTGNVSIDSNIDFGSRKVILFIETGNLEVNAKINLTDNAGFFAVFVNGSISVSSTLNGGVGPAMEGMFLADSGFSTGAGDTQLHIRGSVVSMAGASLQRDLVDNSEPSELFEFAPDLVLLYPSKLGYRAQKWTEVAP